ncbi:MAG: ice-binding family protein, partial [Ilumatobacteraceae bacterium]
TDVSADVGANTAISVVGFPPGIVHGFMHVGDATSSQALADLALAYNDAAGRTVDVEIAGDLNGRTLLPGVYHATAAVSLTGTLTLDGDGDPDAVFIFQLGAAFNTAASSIVNLTNGASSAHVYWQVVGATVIGADASFSGTILTTAAITIGARATFTGQALATTGAITISANTITTPGAAPGALSINVPTGVVDLGRYPNQPGGLTVGGPLGPVQVDDTRGGTATSGWTVTVSATAFTPASGPAIPATAISYSPGPIVQVRGNVVHTVDQPSDLTNATPVVTATGASGQNAAMTMWTPSIAVVVPASAVAGIYAATVTHSVL